MKMVHLMAAATLSFLAESPISFKANAQARPVVCSALAAHYTLMGNENYSAGFVKLPPTYKGISDLAFYLKLAKSNRIIWYTFDEGADGIIHLISTTDVRNRNWVQPLGDTGERPYGSTDIYIADRNLKFEFSPPRSDSPAPFYIFLPGLHDLMWHYINPPDNVDTAFLRFSNCS